MRFSLLISIIFTLAACAKSPYGHLAESDADVSVLNGLRPEFKTVIYQAHIDVTGKHLSGLVIFKNFENGSSRVVFTNEMGVKFFDFEFKDGQFNVIHCIKQLNKKTVINQLKKDFSFILMNGIQIREGKSLTSGDENFFLFKKGKENTYYITDKDGSKLIRAENASKRKKKVILTFKNRKNGMPESILIDHQLFEFKILLNQIERNAEGN